MGLVAWMLIVMMMGAGIGRNSDTLELRELGGFSKRMVYNLDFLYVSRIALPGWPPRRPRTGSRAKKRVEIEALGCNPMFFKTLAAYSWKTFGVVLLSCLSWMAHAQLPYSRALPLRFHSQLIIIQGLTKFLA